MSSFDPLAILSIVFLQLGSKYIKLDITNAQEEIIKHPLSQIILFGCLIFFTTKNIYITIIVVIISYLFIHILFNEKHDLNVLPTEWLYRNNYIKEINSNKDLYINNLNKYHN